MKTLHRILKTITIVGFGIITIVGTSNDNLYADTVPSHQCNEFTFDAAKSQLPMNSNISFSWDFGDGTTSAEPIVTHTYERSGNYMVNLSITDNSGFQCSTATTSQNVRVNIPPHASFTSEDRACVNEPVSFDADASYTNNVNKLRYSWNFGDGTVLRSDSHSQKVYSKGGNYRVILTVDDQTGGACSKQIAEKIVHVNAPPVAEAGDDIVLKCVDRSEDITINFDASATKDINNDSLTYIWDFGDGYKGKGIEAFHRYKTVGNYDVRLVVSDNTNLKCGTDVDFIAVKVNRAPQAEAGEDVLACTGEDINFDGSNSYVHKKGTALARWFFGDGASSNNLYATHRYNRPGTYQATLSLENKLNSMCPISRDTRVITVNSPPNVGIKSLSSECVGKEIFFDASSAADPDGDHLQYLWNFGDGTTSEGMAKVTHEYAQGGNYRVSVIVDDQKGTSCSTATAYRNVKINTPPIADAGSNVSCCVNKNAVFTAGASSDPDRDQLKYIWDFGDGSKAYGEEVNHAYRQSGSYNVLLTVDDQSRSSCSQSTEGFVAVVKDVPVPIIDIR